ncbi:MAG: hypothetical protein SVV80_03585 [Planctomycetota bacterium]|nr:hypothetical protein [Planctomycetota bacterium]
MKDNKNITIAMLCVSAAILATAITLTYDSDQAFADTSIRGGDYIMVTGNVSKSLDLLYVIDIAEQKINVYALDEQNNALRRLDQASLKQMFRDR